MVRLPPADGDESIAGSLERLVNQELEFPKLVSAAARPDPSCHPA
jgi:hypothetical protein